MTDLPEGTPIKQISWDQLQQVQDKFDGWIYPRRALTPFISRFSITQQMALGLYSNGAIIMFVAGLALPFFLDSWWWLLLIPGAVVVWKANRKSMEQFFLKNLSENQAFYDAIRETEMGNIVKIVLREN